jgi:membrane protease YdiL (CAAX protease family)
LVVSTLAAAAAGGGNEAAQKLLDPARSPLLHSTWWILLGTVAAELAVLAVLIAAWHLWRRRHGFVGHPHEERRWLEAVLPTRAPHPKALVGAVLLVIGVAPLAELVAQVVKVLTRSELAVSQVVITVAQRSDATDFGLALLALAGLPALIEEVLFRGVVFTAFARHSTVHGVLVSSLLFGAFHFEPTQAAGTAVLGMAFALGRLYSGSMVTSFVAHAVYNSVVLLSVRWSEGASPDALEGTSPTMFALGLLLGGLGFRMLFAHRADAQRAG